MTQEFQQHWLSAYLDNELSTDERALVEQRLEEDPQSRQLLEDLKSVRGLVATLPAWSGPNFQFDMNRLSSQAENNQADIDEENSDEPDADDSSDLESWRILAAQPKTKSTGWSLSAWRGVLALAAGMLLLILSLPFLLQQSATRLALDSAPNVAAPAGRGMMGDGDAAVMNSAEPMLADTTSFGDAGVPAAETQATVPAMPPEPQAFNLRSSPAAPGAPGPSPREAAGKDGYVMGGGMGIGMGGGMGSGMGGLPGGMAADQASAAPPPSPAFIPPPSAGLQADNSALSKSAATDPAPVGQLHKDSVDARSNDKRSEPMIELAKPIESALAESKKELEAANLPALPAEALSFKCARSDAWSDAEVARALPQLRSIVPDTSAGDAVNQPGATPAPAKPAGNSAVDNEWFIADFPKSLDVNNWYAQIQSSQPLKHVPLPLASSGANAANAKSNSGKEAKATKQSQIVLFLTENEAKKILANVSGPAAESFWRVVPSDQGNRAAAQGAQGAQVAESAANSEKKVIVILNQSP